MSLFSGLLPNDDLFIAIGRSENVVTETLLGNGRPFRFHYSGFQPSCHNMQPSRLLAEVEKKVRFMYNEGKT
jgi:hypothetical protein